MRYVQACPRPEACRVLLVPLHLGVSGAVPGGQAAASEGGTMWRGLEQELLSDGDRAGGIPLPVMPVACHILNKT